MSVKENGYVPISAPLVHPALKKHDEMFENPRVIKVTDHVYVGFGYAIANMIMVEGKKIKILPKNSSITYISFTVIFVSYSRSKNVAQKREEKLI